MKLSKYQYKAVERIVAKCQKQKGMLLYHGMGTGKTITALTILLNYKNDDAVIFCPAYLKFVWKKEMNMIHYGEKHERKTDIKTYKDIEKYNVKDKIVVIDEAHNIIELFRKESYKTSSKILSKLRETKKLILLSGTPIYKDIMDLSYLVNIAAGEDVITYNKTDFVQKYMYINKKNSILRGYLLPISLSSYGSILMTIGINKIINMIPYVLQNIGYDVPYTGENNKNIMSITTNFIAFVIYFIFSNVLTIVNTYDSDFLYEIKMDKFVQNISPYIDYYKPEKNEGFPEKQFHTIYVTYNSLQIKEWAMLVYRIQTHQTKKLNEYEEIDQKNTFFHLDKDNYLQNGRVIGNLSYEINNKYIYAPKFEELKKFIETHPGNHLVYSSFYHKGIILFSHFLQENKIKHAIMTPDTKNTNAVLQHFRENKINILLFHPDLYEGISVDNTQYLHILEPINDFSRYNQVVGRALRKKSHTHLPKNKRIVHVINWVCSINKDIYYLFHKYKDIYEIWFKYYKKIYPEKITKYMDNIDVTPDEIIFRSSDKYIEIEKKLQDILSQNKNNECATGENKVKCKITTLEKNGNCNV